jgi:hypothetical protein
LDGGPSNEGTSHILDEATSIYYEVTVTAVTDDDTRLGRVAWAPCETMGMEHDTSGRSKLQASPAGSSSVVVVVVVVVQEDHGGGVQGFSGICLVHVWRRDMVKPASVLARRPLQEGGGHARHFFFLIYCMYIT